MKYKDIVNLSRQELQAKEQGLREQLYKLNYQRQSGRVEKPHQFTFLRKDIARIKTAISKLDKSLPFPANRDPALREKGTRRTIHLDKPKEYK